MKKIALFLLVFSYIFAEQSTKDKIELTNKNIAVKKSEEKNLSKKIDELGVLIVKESAELKKTNAQIDEITGLVVNLSQKYKDEALELDELNKQTDELVKIKLELEKKIAELIVEDFSFNLIQDNDIKTHEALISNEIFLSLSDVFRKDIANLIITHDKTSKTIDKKNKEISNLEKNLKEYNAKKEELSNAQKKQKKLVENLNKNKEDYIQKLINTQKQSEALSSTLEELKIIDDKEEKEKARKIAQKNVQKQQPQPEILQRDKRVEDIDKKVKLYGSSYKESRVKKYVGSKTISPLKNAFVKRKFGNFIDPVYDIKIFNESVILSSNTQNSQVYNVLDGKVIFAKSTPVLDNVIIVENKNGIHTIYANLSQIAPTIKNGSVIKKGYSIGRVKSDLTFEVTQKNFHIDPLELISLK
ncbi:murein hydrolase activator EnvC family protein [Campylobacter ureolyticus]|uniref:Peptidoglycan DD-metalloendopeptidase family protein n=1 Tax=Campylobacter ureolyticus TaxID=827 RepID=A0A9Q4KNF1_9BACT|nr:peptidoglycan DD-metalloendopeptidase family protein [Campylobacter ureolyticus]MCZ6159748.1 peptidoglycan DD-metalloendopeptidase family protein [Campylobacter ureolyticus]MCZ6163080.1 peptidoglycan DD-metalloendopeptidase family protein [Campylobacter ureolyticus]MCZ6164931.1 peptidoglycan DD-metalloendopeptidase family protein [Campylobacter ureolyticus]MCZ6167657.1 peptidoglycan DD-metalloendopeptidase family protein [Campylobacter ureolyticus]MCZ6172135.1 peptidoglycan DD-metalloendope